jgi:hypothetical protein
MFLRVFFLVVSLLIISPCFPQVSGISSSNLPLVVINTSGQTIQNSAKIQAGMKLIWNGIGKVNKPTDPGNIYDGNIGIEIRGTYSASLPQKPYGFETRDQTGANLDVSLLGMPAENDWILLSNYNDKTFMRNTLAFDLFHKMGHYAPRTQMVEVIVNNVYQGIYILTEKIKRDKGRVDIAKLATKDVAGDDVTGGYIFKIDYYDASNSWRSNYTPIGYPTKSVNYVYADPDATELLTSQKSYLKDAVNSFESILHSNGFADKTGGYPAWIDVNSFIDYFIVSEVSRNVDGFKKSCFFFKDKNSKGGKINAGPVWDFDWAWKNIWDCTFYQVTDGSGWSYKVNDCGNIYPNSNGWMVRLLQDENFANALNKRYSELRNSYLSFSHLQSYIDSVQRLASEAEVRHYTKWNILSSSVGAPEVDGQPSTYAGQVSKFTNWIKTRLTWLDANMPGKSIPTQIGNEQQSFSYRIFPNPASKLVHLESSSIIQEIKIFNSTGKLVLSQSALWTYESKFDVSDLPPGVYIVAMNTTDNEMISIKLIVR